VVTRIEAEDFVSLEEIWRLSGEFLDSLLNVEYIGSNWAAKRCAMSTDIESQWIVSWAGGRDQADKLKPSQRVFSKDELP
jgi:hypothetical protein